MKAALTVLGAVFGIPIALLLMACIFGVSIAFYIFHTWDEGEGK